MKTKPLPDNKESIDSSGLVQASKNSTVITDQLPTNRTKASASTQTNIEALVPLTTGNLVTIGVNTERNAQYYSDLKIVTTRCMQLENTVSELKNSEKTSDEVLQKTIKSHKDNLSNNERLFRAKKIILTSEIDRLYELKNKLYRENAIIQEELYKTNEALKKEKSEHQLMVDGNSKLQAHIQATNLELSCKNNKIAQLESTNKYLTSYSEKVDNQLIIKVKSKSQDLKEKTKKTERKLHSEQESVDEYRKNMEQHQLSYKKTKQQLQETEQRLQSLQNMQTQHQEKIHDLNRRHQNRQQDDTKSIEKLKAANKEKDDTIALLQQKLSEANNELQNLHSYSNFTLPIEGLLDLNSAPDLDISHQTKGLEGISQNSST